MGCWNENIYGGDASLEWRENMYNFCKATEYDSKLEIKPIPLKKLTSKLESLIEMVEKCDTEDDDKNIGYIVLGAIIMHSGFDIKSESELKERIISAAEQDEWSKDNSLRKTVMSNYIKILNEYNPSEPVNIENVNVLEETKPNEEEEISNQFKDIFVIMNSRINKLKKDIDEKSSNKDYDEGVADASQGEIDFLTDFKEIFNRQEQLAIIYERISSGVDLGFSGNQGTQVAKGSSVGKSSGGGKDMVAG